jgi:stearoyl-CoA desaturase (delta-9 desaturase)
MQTLLERPEEIRGVVRLTAAQLRLQRRITMVLTVGPLTGVALAIWRLWGTGITTLDLALFGGFYVATGLGITVGYHRLFTHRSFRAAKPLRVALAVCGSMAVQGSIISWCSTHRRHHAYADEYGDPHSPHLATAPGLKGVLSGLWHAHLGWLFDKEGTNAAEWAPDLQSERAIARVDRAFPWLTLATFFLPPLLALAITGSPKSMIGAFIWASLVRIFLLHHVTWSINSICHFYGKEAYRARDESRNVWPLAPLSFGESWHNNHHAFPWSARLGLRAWQIDPGWYAISIFRALGMARDVKVPSPKQLADRSLR